MTIETDMEVGSPSSPYISYLYPQFLGLNSLDLIKKNNSTKAKAAVRTAIAAMKDAAASSDWNFTNKLRLLEAEQQSLRQTHRKAVPLYEAAIESAKKSGFIHEQGLACEKAAFYFMRLKNKEKALEYFQQARECYFQWGSFVKVDFIQKELDGLNWKN